MSRFADYDSGDSEYAVLDHGRWERNARAALKGKRGRKALRDLREALLALPGHRLIDSALCTVGGVDKRLPAMTDEEVAAKEAEIAALGDYAALHPDWPRRHAEFTRRSREEDRRKLAEVVSGTGEGVCAIGAYLWHKRVKEGMDPAEAFASLPTVFGGEEDGGDPLNETARLGEDAGLAYTLAWELAYRNDETYGARTPEDRWAAFVAWIDAELGTGAAA